MVIRMAYFPEHLAVPVRFQDHASFERKAAEKAVLRRAPVVEQCPALGEIAGQAWGVRHVPGMDDVAGQVDEIDSAVSPDKGSKQGKPWSGALWVERAQPNTPALGGVLLDRRRRCLLAALQRATGTCRGGARAENGGAGEQRAAVQAEGLVIGHRDGPP